MKHSTIFYYCLLISTGLYGSENPDMGVTDLNVSHCSGYPSNPKLSYGSQTEVLQIVKMGYDSDTATQDDINVSIQSSDPRPTTVRVRYVSSPWLNYPDGGGGGCGGIAGGGDEYFDVFFPPKPTKWTGHGKTGYVVDDDINTVKSRRVEW